MIKKYIGLLFALFLLISGFAIAVENRGAAQMTLVGGTRGDVPFPHDRHQTALVDCNICHTHFPQQSGAIEELKEQGKLKKKQIMKQCTVCHRNRAKAGQAAGPIRCKTCHQK